MPSLFPCPCCGFLFKTEEPYFGNYGICHICDWEDCDCQLANPLDTSGPNGKSFVQHQASVLERYPAHVRFVQDSGELLQRSPEWRPLTSEELAEFEAAEQKGQHFPGIRDLKDVYWMKAPATKLSSMRHAVYAGSFDPITNGHLWMIDHGRRLVDQLTVAIGINPDKKYLFPLQDRLDMLTEATAAFPNVKVATFENLFLVHYARQIGATVILRGIRNEQDYSYERGMRYINAEFAPDITTAFLIPPRENAEISSSFVKGLVGPQGWQDLLKTYVPPGVHRRFTSRFK